MEKRRVKMPILYHGVVSGNSKPAPKPKQEATDADKPERKERDTEA